MKRGVGCRVGGISVRRIEVAVTFQGQALDVTFSLVDPDTKAILGMTRKTRNWSPTVREKLTALIEALEQAGVESVFSETTESPAEQSIAEHLGKTEGQY